MWSLMSCNAPSRSSTRPVRPVDQHAEHLAAVGHLDDGLLRAAEREEVDRDLALGGAVVAMAGPRTSLNLMVLRSLRSQPLPLASPVTLSVAGTHVRSAM